MAGICRRAGDGTLLTLRLTPKGGCDAIEGVGQLADGRSVLLVRVRAVAVDGAANIALRRFLGKTLRLAPSSVTLVAGATSRLKTMRLDAPYDVISNWLETLDKIAPIACSPAEGAGE